MNISYIRQLASLAGGFFAYLKNPMTLQQAMNDLKRRMDHREDNFLKLAKLIIYENQNSPYRKLLLWAGCDYKDLEDSVRNVGLEKTLESLRDEGVYLTLQEFKSKTPICRKGLTIETIETDFDNPFFMSRCIQASTSGSRSKGTRVMYNWDFISEEAANELVLYEIHDLSTAPLALWLPALPAISGIHNILMNIKFNRPPERWFSHLGGYSSFKDRLTTKYIILLCKLFKLSVPRPEHVGIGRAVDVVNWMANTKKSKGISVVRTYASSAIRIVQSAMEHNLNIGGCVFFTGGEPLTDRKYSFINLSGAMAFPRYVATEIGLIGASCRNRNSPDDMHAYLDRLAVIQMLRLTETGYPVNSFLFTTLSVSSGKVLLNTDIGDFGNLTVKSCSCLFGELGMNIRLSNVRSYDKLTGEGMTLLGSELDNIVGELIEYAGGCPNDYQFWEIQDDNGLHKLIIAISPKLKNIDEGKFIRAIFDRLNKQNQGSRITSQIWQQAGMLSIIRADPEITKGYKMLPILKKNRLKSL